MPRDYKVYLDDILDAVVRNLEVIGEAAKKIPDDVRRRYTAIEWKKIAGLRWGSHEKRLQLKTV